MEGRPILSVMFLSWWYGERFVQFCRYLEKMFLKIADLFSVEVCLKTLFSVWRRDEIDYHDLSLKEILEAWTLNLASRFIGFVVKSSTLAAYLVATVLFLALALTAILIWLLYPLIIIALIIYGISRMVA